MGNTFLYQLSTLYQIPDTRYGIARWSTAATWAPSRATTGPRMSKSVTKAWIVACKTEWNRMIPRFSFIRSGDLRSFVTDLDTNELIPPW